MHDLKLLIRTLPESFQRNKIQESVPNITEEGIEDILLYLQKINENDPLSILKHVGDEPSEFGQQLLMMNMSPNLEVSLYLAQLTGAFIVTDSLFRWRELLRAQQRDLGIVVQRAPKLVELIGNSKHRFLPEVQDVVTRLSKGSFKQYRRFIQELYDATTSGASEIDFENLLDRFTEALEASEKWIGRSGVGSFGGKINCVIPSNGISHNTSHRMLLTGGQDRYLNSVPMAFYLSREDIEIYKSQI